MQQKEIKSLLAELAKADCASDRWHEIADSLYEAAKRGPAPDSPNDPTSDLFMMIITRLLSAKPQCLPGLFPVFVLFCGDRRPTSMVADIDWSLMP